VLKNFLIHYEIIGLQGTIKKKRKKTAAEHVARAANGSIGEWCQLCCMLLGSGRVGDQSSGTRRTPVQVVLCTADDTSQVWRAALAAR